MSSQSSLAKRRSPSLANTINSIPPIAHLKSNHSVAELTMDEAPAQTSFPRAFTSNALSDAELNAVTDLLGHLRVNSYAYDSHVHLVNLLHKGLLDHTRPPSDGTDPPPRDPHLYDLLAELRQAREAMDSRFGVGEALWLDWLSDEMLLANSCEERLAVTELCQKAVSDEPASVKLWQAYADWTETNYAACHDIKGAKQHGWTDQDKELCRELFSADMLLNVFEQAIAATQWRIDESHLLWNRYIAFWRQLTVDSAPQPDYERLQDIFLQRLRVPHAAWNETAQLFWPLVSDLHGDDWEAAMSHVNELAQPAKIQMGLRDEHELRLQRAVDAGDQAAIFDEFTRYLKWEKLHKQRASLDNELRYALYERALLHFPTHTDWWLDYVDFLISQKPSSHDPSSSVLPLIERATRHCPWSGDLWARRILRSDVERKPHHEIESTKHRATNSGLLDVGGMEDLLKVLMEWCSYLRRHAFTATSSEDEIDTAEVGITMALEDVQQAGKRIYGDDFEGDPLHRLEQIHIKFLTMSRRLDEARGVWRGLIPKTKGSYEFWFMYYRWELSIWGHHRMMDRHRVETTETAPHYATAVLEDALSQKDLDWPEKIADLYLTHFRQHESVEKLQTAVIEARDFLNRLGAKRAKEAQDAAAQAAQHNGEIQIFAADEGNGEKRKREDDVPPPGETTKRARTDDAIPPGAEPSSSMSAQTKRDREHCTLTMKNLPHDATELDIRKFFRDCGTVNAVHVLPDSNTGTVSATVEFELQEDVAAAKTRNGRTLLGREVHIYSGSQSTLYVANYPAESDETAIRSLFEAYGEIISVRFPSLKYNNRRRFCYVQFLLAEQAKAAEGAMDGKMLDGAHRLLAKVSDPDAKKHRGGAQAEGREIFVKNIENAASEEEIQAFFAQYGSVISMNLLKNVAGKRLGNGFVVFSSADEATRAVEKANNKPLRDRILHLALSTPKGGATAPLDKARKTDVIVKHSASPEPSGGATNGLRRGSDTTKASDSRGQDVGGDGWKTARERRVAIFNVPDTVTDARITAEMEKHGAVVKLQLRREQGAAVVEFADVKAAFAVREGAVDCAALGPDARTGDVGELFAKPKKAAGAAAMRPSVLSRPGQRGARRGGLGVKRGGLGVGKKADSGDDGGGGGARLNGSAARSNADFKAMFEKSKGEGGP